MTPGDDQIPWVRNAFATGNENQVDRLVYDGIPGKLDERPVGYERCVERGECVLRDRRHAREMPILILGGGVPERLEAGDRLRPQIVEPRWTGLLPLKILAIGFDRAGRAGAGHSAAPLPGFSRHYVPSDRN